MRTFIETKQTSNLNIISDNGKEVIAVEEVSDEIERLKKLIDDAYYAGKLYGIAEMKEYHGGSENNKPTIKEFKQTNNL